MVIKIYFSDAGSPATGLSPTWESLRRSDTGADVSGSAPSISEIGGGWYKATFVYGSGAWAAKVDLAGVVDGGSSLDDVDRYVPVAVSIRDLALAKLVHKASYNLADGVETIRNETDTADELQLAIAESDGLETRTPQ